LLAAKLSFLTLSLCACGRFGFDIHDVAGDAHGGSGDANNNATDGMLADSSSDGAAASGWTVFSPAPTTTTILTSVVGVAANDWWIAGNGPEVYQFGGTSWTARPGPTTNVQMMWAQSPTDVWETGLNCDVRRWNGTTWTPSPPTGCSSDSYLAIGGMSATDLWLAGSFGNLEHLVGTTWTALPQGNNIDLWSVWAASTNDVYVSGTKGSIRHWTGSMATEDIAQNLTVSTMWGSSASDVWAVGATGIIYHKVNQGAWTQVTSPTTQFLYGMWGTAANDIWAVGDNATILHYDGSQWSSGTVAGIPATTSLRWVHGIPGDGVRAVGTGGIVLTHP
jgi:hypothetical protein